MAKRSAEKCKNSFRNFLKRLQTHVIPSEVEESRRITAG